MVNDEDYDIDNDINATASDATTATDDAGDDSNEYLRCGSSRGVGGRALCPLRVQGIAQVGACWVPTADQINSIKPEQAVGYWSDSVGMSGRGRSDRLLPDGYSTVHDHFPIGIRPYTSSVPDPLDLYPSLFRSLRTPEVRPSRSGRVKIWWRSS
ncbi:hypothetical protein DPMN_120880 [Dreissena polymorpha]|uniref:Uncharacterized protein n=1 Tax=Dreissena polymorpha TaxID=45954 RepID=A0A9D4GLM0_DREPO|nr:hypothetical protein DPMN_120880 [Dreissena polymorpha]